MTAAREIVLRPAGPEDAEVLYRIYASTREEELAVVPWDAPAKEAFLRMQFTAQHADYHARYPDASYDLIMAGEQVLGRLYLDRGGRAWHVIDIALLPEHRGKGIGTRLLTELLAEAGAAARPVQIYVERFNPARHLYDRLGFRQIAEQGIYLLLERHPSTAGPCGTRQRLPEHRFVTHRRRLLPRRNLVWPDRHKEQLQRSEVLMLEAVNALRHHRLKGPMKHQGKRDPGPAHGGLWILADIGQLCIGRNGRAALRRLTRQPEHGALVSAKIFCGQRFQRRSTCHRSHHITGNQLRRISRR